MKYIIDIPSKADFVTAYYMEDGLPVMYKSDRIDDLEPYTEPDRKVIEDEVWEFAKYVSYHMDRNDYIECFDKLYDSYTYQEAKAKYEAWKKQKEEIHVGDEVEYESCGEVVKFIVTGVIGSRVYGFKSPCDYDDVGDYSDIDGLHKTGRHFPEVAELLKKMRGDNE